MSAQDTAVAKRYAKALFEVAQEKGIVPQVEEELQGLRAVLNETPELVAFLNHPKIDAEAKVNVLSKALEGKASEALLNTVRLLIERRREGLLSALVEDYVRIANEALGQADALVVSAFPLTADEEGQIASQFGKLTGKQIRIETLIDRSLLGGIQVRIGDRLYDGSLSGKLSRLEKSLQNNQAL